MKTDKKQIMKATRAALLIYVLVIGILGTAMFATFIFWVVPKDKLSKVIEPFSIAALFLYGTCIAAILIRETVFSKEKINNE
ncbi:hypothetical protein SAMN05421663_101401 [Terribacillus halophilus]|uniref:Uncharacterized protein n=1 Tax=Terribacillus halophilus TaxID=361279 RepID=A0A1G6IY24_9BACI|nr:hypothetical protein [Terribacillus halophilus]SDC10686.1 hypothetical protein SAMN05421663_101401 [Terribacillus halophilus]